MLKPFDFLTYLDSFVEMKIYSDEKNANAHKSILPSLKNKIEARKYFYIIFK